MNSIDERIFRIINSQALPKLVRRIASWVWFRWLYRPDGTYGGAVMYPPGAGFPLDPVEQRRVIEEHASKFLPRDENGELPIILDIGKLPDTMVANDAGTMAISRGNLYLGWRSIPAQPEDAEHLFDELEKEESDIPTLTDKI